jgi:hypothetical protein
MIAARELGCRKPRMGKISGGAQSPKALRPASRMPASSEPGTVKSLLLEE